MSRHPAVKWAQRPDVVYLTVQLPDAKNPKVNLDPEGIFTFSATAGAESHLYELKLELHDKVNVEESKINIGVRNIFCVLEKSEKKWWSRLLRGDEKAPHYVKVDWDKWVDEDDDNETAPGDFDMNSMDFSKFGGMGGMGGLGDDLDDAMGDDFDDSDDEGGMGGMGGLGDDLDDAVGDDFDDSDDEEEEVTKPSENVAGEPKEQNNNKVEGESAEGKSEATPNS